MGVYFIGDLHFFHKNVLLYEPIRMKWVIDKYLSNEFDDFDDVVYKYKTDNEFKERVLNLHNQIIIDRWNEVVGDDDIVWVLGDISMGRHSEVRPLLQQLKGHKYLVIGNHDADERRLDTPNHTARTMKAVEKFYDMGFEFVSPKPVEVVDGFWVSHEPKGYINDNYPCYNVYAHVHSSVDYKTETSKSLCVSLERHEGYPVKSQIYDELVKKD